MIVIEIGKCTITAHGHAADAVGCAAVSALLYALAGGLENASPESRWHIGSGEAAFSVADTPAAQAMRLLTEVGLRQLAAVRKDIRIIVPMEPEGLKSST